jgi:hypothetical protein
VLHVLTLTGRGLGPSNMPIATLKFCRESSILKQLQPASNHSRDAHSVPITLGALPLYGPRFNDSFPQVAVPSHISSINASSTRLLNFSRPRAYTEQQQQQLSIQSFSVSLQHIYLLMLSFHHNPMPAAKLRAEGPVQDTIRCSVHVLVQTGYVLSLLQMMHYG